MHFCPLPSGVTSRRCLRLLPPRKDGDMPEIQIGRSGGRQLVGFGSRIAEGDGNPESGFVGWQILLSNPTSSDDELVVRKGFDTYLCDSMSMFLLSLLSCHLSFRASVAPRP